MRTDICRAKCHHPSLILSNQHNSYFKHVLPGYVACCFKSCWRQLWATFRLFQTVEAIRWLVVLVGFLGVFRIW